MTASVIAARRAPTGSTRMTRKIVATSWAAVMVVSLLVTAAMLLQTPAASAQFTDLERVTATLNVTYIGGVTNPMARRLFYDSDIPHLISILDTGNAFPRQDNTVVFLGHLSNDTHATVPALRRYFSNFVTAETPEARRSILLIPHALSLMAQLTQSLEALLFMQDMLADLTDPLNNILYAVLPQLSPNQAEQDEMLAGMVKQLLRGLSFYNGTVLQSAVQTLDSALDLVAGDDGLTDSLTSLVDGIAEEVDSGVTRVLEDEEGDDSLFTFLTGGFLRRRRSSDASADASAETHRIALNWCQHAAVSGAFSNSDISSVTDEMTRVAKGAQTSYDVGCCLEFTNLGQGQRFGAQGDGLSIVDSKREASMVFGKGCGRIKVVNVINYCGQPASNVIGCAPVGGDTQMVVRLSSHASDARLWLHETGHNVGLAHNGENENYVMYPTLTGNVKDNFALTQQECSAFHTPPPTARVNISPINSTCTSNQSPPGSDNNDFSDDDDDDDDDSGGGSGNGGSSASLDDATSWAVLGLGVALALVAVVLVATIARKRAANNR